MTHHSSIVGGSTAGRLLACPGSYQATLALPPSADISSEYAEEGTAMHAVMAHLMHDRLICETRGVPFDGTGEQYIGNTQFHDRVLTPAHIDEMIAPALSALAELEIAYGGDFKVLAIEQSVRFPGVPGAYGTIDLILGSPVCVLHVDWKFGSGIPVTAATRHGDSETLNPQLMFYTVAAKASARHFYRGVKDIVIAIVQPRSEVPLSHALVRRKDLTWFRQDLAGAVEKALDRAPIRARGEHCRFAPCKVNCPLWTGPLLDLSVLSSEPVATVPAEPGQLTPYGEYLSRAKTLVDLAAMFKKTLDEQLHAYLEEGGTVPGWRLKAKVKQRQWIDEATVSKALLELGFEPDEIYRTQLQTFAAADAIARRLGVKIPDTLRVAPPTNETTVCATDDPAPVVEKRLVLEAFASALENLKQSA
jgi:hypothetical protein